VNSKCELILTLGGEQQMTRSTSGMSKPRAATSVVIKTLYFPSRNFFFKRKILKLSISQSRFLSFLVSVYLKDELTLVLRHIAVHHVRLDFYLATARQLVGVLFGLTKDHGTTVLATVDLQDATDCGRSVLITALNG
jgi:hypothetical protein